MLRVQQLKSALKHALRDNYSALNITSFLWSAHIWYDKLIYIPWWGTILSKLAATSGSRGISPTLPALALGPSSSFGILKLRFQFRSYRQKASWGCNLHWIIKRCTNSINTRSVRIASKIHQNRKVHITEVWAKFDIEIADVTVDWFPVCLVHGRPLRLTL